MIITQSSKRKAQSYGFTLIELLVVMSIMALLVILSVANYRNVQIKARDGQRKSDLSQLQRSLEMFYNDYGSYPLSSAAGGGQIKVGAVSLNWKTPESAGSEFVDSNGTVYMKELVGDPAADRAYCYKSAGTSYQIYAKLENIQDPRAAGPYGCGGDNTYNYGIASANSSL